MLQPETIERGRELMAASADWLRAMIELEKDPHPEARVRFALTMIAAHLRDWSQWAEDLERELLSP